MVRPDEPFEARTAERRGWIKGNRLDTIPPPDQRTLYVPITVAGEGWIDAFYDWFPSPQWMQIRPRTLVDEPLPNLPTVLPPSVQTAEVCFRRPDGWIVCTIPGIWEQSYRNQGFPEVSSSAPEFVPPATAEVNRVPPTDVVSSHPSEAIPEDEVPFHGDSWVDWGIGVINQANTWGQQPIYNFGGPGAGGTPPPVDPGPQMMGGACNCNRNPCVCGVDSCGRPALINALTGKRCYRRRRRRLMTDRDFDDLMRIATLPNKQNVSVALAKALGRR